MRHFIQRATLASLFCLTACSPATPADTSSGLKGEAVSEASGVLRYPASDFVEQRPGVRGGTLRVSAASDAGSFDIHALSNGNIQWLGRILFDCLVYQAEDGSLTPWLAKSWDISADGLTYTFHLRDDVTFSDGERFNAEAVRVNLEHMRDPRTKSPLTAAYIAPYLSGRVIDEYTFEATLRAPYAPFLDVLAQAWLGMISPRQILEAPKTIASQPIGTGPFVLSAWTRDQGARFERREGYRWAPAAINHPGEAYLDSIELSYVPEAMIRYTALEAADSDMALDAPAQNAAAIRANPALTLRNRIRKGNPSRSITFNVERPPFDDVRVRQAVAKAVDRDGLAWVSGFGEYLAKGDFLAVNTPGYDPVARDALAYDPLAAGRLLDAAGWTGRDREGFRTRDGQRLRATLLTYDNPAFPANVPVAAQADLRKVGFDLQIELLPISKVMELRYAGQFDAFGGGYWHTNTADGLFILYHSDSIPSARMLGQNVGHFRDASLDRLLGEARRSTDPAQRRALYRQAQQRLGETVPAVPSVESQMLVAYRNAVGGVLFDGSHNVPLFTSVWLAKEQP
ncbi:ABC transporter substrate-binding protein [Pseudomonas xantholysinigenes]|uniref:ABC transporter substrate-binding protein n=1 Tax=Pseudomonas xantholysinigenes TaxID=2745490 RepID=A0A9E6PS69_9PSED|nr:ABC transporter substrate-binding protein [Pseudomonas xantholysinigenes]QXI36454.1 ABC transporter substrate-binding protein [Pseudomonas xantholysinigenes]